MGHAENDPPPNNAGLRRHAAPESVRLDRPERCELTAAELLRVEALREALGWASHNNNAGAILKIAGDFADFLITGNLPADNKGQ